ncbi:MAG: aldehyde dehydrogenase family protein [Verrucomicrobiota bacterium]|nr:aldehyde dehydrogenase family protein [Verrucomicrobiota bacterium]
MLAPFSRQLLIGNRWLSTGARLPVIDPYTGGEIARVPLGNAELIQSAIATAHAAFATTRAIPAHARATLLHEVARSIERRRAEFADTIVAEAGKPITFAKAEVERAIMTFTIAAEEARRLPGELLNMDALPSGEGYFGAVRRFPMGVVTAITPFNFPLNLVAHKVGPSLATGNTMVLKPASKTPLSALLLAEVLVEAGMPAGQVNVVTCTNEDAALLITDERVRKISFTGSPAVGWKLKQQCGRKRITLELGGNAGVIIHEDASLDAAIPAIATGAFAQAGQSCISVQRVIVHRSLYDEFKTRFVAHVKEKVKTGDPREGATVVGPMITDEALQKIVARIEEARNAGATILCGGNVQGPCLEATVLENVAATLPLCAQEAFAPIATLHRYDDFDEALAFVNDSQFGLQAGVFTSQLPLAMRAFDALEVGGVLINQVPTFRVEHMPYGGVKESGFGREGLRYAMDEMTELKTLIVKL